MAGSVEISFVAANGTVVALVSMTAVANSATSCAATTLEAVLV